MSEPDRIFLRRDAAAALTSAGFPVSPATLATLACRGGGPRYSKFGARAVYRWHDLIAWAQARCSDPRRVACEADAA